MTFGGHIKMAFKIKTPKKKIIYDIEYYLGSDPKKTKYYKDEMKRRKRENEN
jgi:hypothetical protein